MKTKFVVVVVALASALLALLAVRSLTTAALAAMVAGLSASAVAGTGKGSAVVGVHLPAMVGAIVGSLLLSLQMQGKPWPERAILIGASCVAAYFGGVAAGEWWGLGYGSIGLAGTCAAYLLIAVLNLVLSLLRDVGWWQRLLHGRFGGGGGQ